MMHQNTTCIKKPNKKYVSFDGYFEAVYSYDNKLLNEETAPEDMGTYNYAPSTAWKDGNTTQSSSYFNHMEKDVITYNFWQNTEEEMKQKKKEYLEELRNDR